MSATVFRLNGAPGWDVTGDRYKRISEDLVTPELIEIMPPSP
jgi:hypothetical protein